MSLNRRSLFLGSMGAALGAGTVLPARAQVPAGCGEQPKTAPALPRSPSGRPDAGP